MSSEGASNASGRCWRSLAEALRDELRGFVAPFVDALVPPRCALCGSAVQVPASAADELVCALHALPDRPSGSRCGRCAGRLPLGVPDGARCAACRRDARGFAHVTALADYGSDPALRAWILALKYGGRADLARPLGRALARALWERGDLLGPAAPPRRSGSPASSGSPGSPSASGWLGPRARQRPRESGPTCVVPVPLHRWRRLERGYDQAALLAKALADELGLAQVRALARTRATAPQGAPGAVSRAANVRGVFALQSARTARAVRGAQIVLVDDVLTSGATATACARVLRRAGARRVVVACLARA